MVAFESGEFQVVVEVGELIGVEGSLEVGKMLSYERQMVTVFFFMYIYMFKL